MTDNLFSPATAFSQRTLALVAGISLLVMALVAGVAFGYGFQQALYGLAFGGFSVILILDLIAVWALYGFFAPVDRTQAWYMAWLRLGYVVALAAALGSLSGVFGVDSQSPGYQALIAGNVNSFLEVWSAGLVIFGGHLWMLGLLMRKSGQVPALLWGLMLFAGVCYVGTNLANLLLPAYSAWKSTIEGVLALPMALGELGLAIWLIARGGRGR